jgi:AhpD family alkylhydroperoxidase
MTSNLNLFELAHQATVLLSGLDEYIHGCGLDRRLAQLVSLRMAQLAGCGHFIAEHSLQAQAAGESHERLNAAADWRTKSFFSHDERAALELVEALAAGGPVPTRCMGALRQHFSDKEICDLSIAAARTMAWSMLANAFLPVRRTKPPRDFDN